jgi:hypothetical protein
MSDDEWDRIDDLRKRFDEHAQLDREELGCIKEKLDEHGETLAKLRESAAGTKVALEALTDEMRHRRAETVEIQKTKRARMSGRMKIGAAAIGAASAVITALLTYLAT